MWKFALLGGVAYFHSLDWTGVGAFRSSQILWIFLWIIVFVDWSSSISFLCCVALISRFLCNAPAQSMLMSSDNWALHYFVVLTQNKMVSVMTFRLQNWELKIRHWHFIFYTGGERTKADLQINLQIHLQLWAHPCRFVSGLTSKWI